VHVFEGFVTDRTCKEKNQVGRVASQLRQVSHQPRDFGQNLARQKAHGTDGGREVVTGRGMQVNSPAGGNKRVAPRASRGPTTDALAYVCGDPFSRLELDYGSRGAPPTRREHDAKDQPSR
jgi:hypothetical protein